jgi:Bardet-Biedl syndrome 4 protein
MQKLPSKESKNWLVFMLYIRNEPEDCLKVIEEILKEFNNRNDLVTYIKGLILRSRGEIQQSLEMLKWSQKLNPVSMEIVKQVGRCLHLMGRSKAAIDVYDQALKLSQDDWEIWHCKGMCHTHRNEIEDALECFHSANLIQKHDVTFIQQGELLVRKEDYKSAIDTYLEALEFSPENPELLTTLGLLYLRLSENLKSFQYLGNALTLDPINTKALLATGSIIQDRSDHDAALLKYRIIAIYNPNSAQLWNNIAMCFFGKGKYVATIACLKKAQYLDPFEWIIAYNLGIAHLSTMQYASAFHYFNAAISLNPYFASSYMYLALALSNLGDIENACMAYEKAASLEEDFLIYLNYSITLKNYGNKNKAREMFSKFKELFEKLDAVTRELDPDIQNKSRLLQAALE